MYMGFFGVRCGHLLLCYYGRGGRRRARADRYRMARDVREDPGDSDAHLFTDRGHLGQRPATGAGGRGRFWNQGNDGPKDCS